MNFRRQRESGHCRAILFWVEEDADADACCSLEEFLLSRSSIRILLYFSDMFPIVPLRESIVNNFWEWVDTLLRISMDIYVKIHCRQPVLTTAGQRMHYCWTKLCQNSKGWNQLGILKGHIVHPTVTTDKHQFFRYIVSYIVQFILAKMKLWKKRFKP